MSHPARLAAALPLILALLLGGAAARAEEMIAVRSAAPVADSIERLRTVAVAAGFAVVARVDHAKAAASVGLALRPTEALIFGNPRGGTPLMQCDQRIGLDLPLRALAWQDEGGQVWLGMTDPKALRVRYGLGATCDGPLGAMEAGVRRLLERATAR